MHKKIFCFFLISFLQYPLLQSQQPARPEGIRSFEENVPMSDGVMLSTHIYLPETGKTGKRYPAILVRTPYNKDLEMWFDKRFLSHDIVIVTQDVRGKYKSGGDFYPFANERSDGLETLRWIRKQPWSNGTVGGWGPSYMGYTQWSIADSLDFLSPLLAGSNMYDFIYPDGIFSLQSAFLWGYANVAKDPAEVSPQNVRTRLSRVPLSAATDSVLFLSDWLRHETEDEYWRQINFHGPVKAPVISVAGWYDIFLKAQIKDFQALADSGHVNNKLIIGPWAHGLQGRKNDYGGEAKAGSYGQMMFDYAVKVLQGKSPAVSGPLREGKFNFFIMERNEYVGSDVWPPRETRVVSYFLNADNSLTTHPASPDKMFFYVYDPTDPYPNYGGTFLGDSVGPAYQNRNLARQDQVAFETEVLEKPLALLGPITAAVWLSSDACCTDFIVCLQDVFPDGRIVNIQEGGARVHFKGRVPEKKDISVWATGYQLNPGHKLRAVITSSWFPRFNRSLNVCDPIYSAQDIRKATQKIYVGAATPSCIHLPVYEAQNK